MNFLNASHFLWFVCDCVVFVRFALVLNVDCRLDALTYMHFTCISMLALDLC